MDEIHALFPTPVLRRRRLLAPALVDVLVAHFVARADLANNSSALLNHTALLQPEDSPLLGAVVAAVTPALGDFGALMLGEALGWSVKEMWVNLLETGGHQAMHNHANSFISGVLYLTASDDAARTTFMRSPGGTDFLFRNDHAGVTQGPYNAAKWVSPAPEPGDLILFPSYLMHAVPHNPGPRRITLAFNAIPTRLDSWGYRVSFGG